jgi:hypothetical protein
MLAKILSIIDENFTYWQNLNLFLIKFLPLNEPFIYSWLNLSLGKSLNSFYLNLYIFFWGYIFTF